MSLFDFGGDSDPSAGFLNPMVAQAMRYDPRSALIAQMLQTGQSQLQQPAYSPMAGIAKALTMGLGGLSSANLTNQYAKASQGFPQEMATAMESQDPVAALASSKNPLSQYYAMQLAPEMFKNQLGIRAKWAEQGLMPDPNNPGTLMPIPGRAVSSGTIAQGTAYGEQAGKNQAEAATGPAVIAAETPAKAAQAGAIKMAEVPGNVAAARGTSAAQAFTDLFKPQVDRLTGEVSIPGINNPAAAKAVGDSLGITPQMLGGKAWGVPVAAPPVAAPAEQGAGTEGTPAQQSAARAILATPAAQAAASPSNINKAGTPPAPSPQIVNPNSGSPSQQAIPQKTPVPIGAMNPADEIPAYKLPSPLLPAGPGTIIQGRNPTQLSSNEEAIKAGQKEHEEVADTATAATLVQSQLGTMKAQLDRGQLTTNMTGDIRTTLAGLIYVVGGSNDAAAQAALKATGINPASADVFNKESFRLGASLSRTLGAREAAQIVQQAIKANPNLLNTVEGNKMVIGLLDSTAQHDIDAQTYSNAWFQKNGHYVGAKAWFDQNHPVQEYTSKVVPYELPRLSSGKVNPAALKPNVTYNIQSDGHTGPAIWTGQGFAPIPQ